MLLESEANFTSFVALLGVLIVMDTFPTVFSKVFSY